MKSATRQTGLLVSTCVAWAVALLIGAQAAAQAYKSDEVDKRLSARGSLFRNYVKQPGGDAEQRQRFEEYLTKYYLPAMTQPSPEALEDLGKMRSEFFSRFLWPATPELQAYMTQQAYEWAKRVATGPYHPAVQFNAIYTMSLLDAKYAGRGQAEPSPLPAANDELNKYARLAAQKERIPRRYLAAALGGLERHTRYFGNLPEKQQTETLKTLVGVLRASELPGDYEKEVLGWIYVSAAQALANTKSAGPRGLFFLEVAKHAGDTQIDLDSRAELAATLSEFNVEKGAFDAAPAVTAIRDLASRIAKAESKIAREFEDLQIGGGVREIGGGRGNRARRFRMGEQEIELVRDDLLVRLNNLQSGVRAVANVAADADAASLTEIDQAIELATRRLRDKDEIDLNVADAIKQMATRVLAAAEVEAKPADEPAEESEAEPDASAAVADAN